MREPSKTGTKIGMCASSDAEGKPAQPGLPINARDIQRQNGAYPVTVHHVRRSMQNARVVDYYGHALATPKPRSACGGRFHDLVFIED